MKTIKLIITTLTFFGFAVTNMQAQTLPSYVPTNGLVGYWGFNGNANDQSGNGNNGTVNGATLTTDRFGNANSAYSFDGVSNHISLNNSICNFGTNDFTLSAWILKNSLLAGSVIGKRNSGADGNMLILASSPSYEISSGSGDYFANNTLPSYNALNTWFHIVLVRSGNSLKSYINGQLVDNYISPTIHNINNSAITEIGARYSESSIWNLWNGKIDDIAIYNRALTQSEITQLYSSSASIQNLCTKTIQPYNVNVGDDTHEGSTYAWSITPAAPNAVISGNGTNTITIDWTNVPDGSYTLQAIETSITGCVSTAVAATINLSATAVPTAQSQTFCTNATVANLVATGNNLQWYSSPTGGAALDTIAILTSGTYYVSQTVGNCESLRTAVSVTVTPQTTPTFTPIASTCSGSNLTALPTNSNNGITGSWSPALNNNETTTYTFTPNVGQCATTATQIITINAPKVTSPISFVAPPVTVAALPIVTIGTQVWTNKNLDVSTYRDGTPIPQVTDQTEWANLTTGAWCYYNNDPANGAIYGKLYNWYAVAGIHDNDPNTPNKILAPLGWHVPTDAEWTTLTDYLGGESVAGNKMKATTLWQPSSGITNTNSSGFTGLPGGFRYYYGSFYFIGNYGFWWSSSEYDSTFAWNRFLGYNTGYATRATNYKKNGSSVRCLRD